MKTYKAFLRGINVGGKNTKAFGFANNLHRIDLPSTVRNWNTVMKLADLAKMLDD